MFENEKGKTLRSKLTWLLLDAPYRNYEILYLVYRRHFLYNYGIYWKRKANKNQTNMNQWKLDKELMNTWHTDNSTKVTGTFQSKRAF